MDALAGRHFHRVEPAQCQPFFPDGDEHGDALEREAREPRGLAVGLVDERADLKHPAVRNAVAELELVRVARTGARVSEIDPAQRLAFERASADLGRMNVERLGVAWRGGAGEQARDRENLRQAHEHRPLNSVDALSRPRAEQCSGVHADCGVHGATGACVRDVVMGV